jgi:hypothetical protein
MRNQRVPEAEFDLPTAAIVRRQRFDAATPHDVPGWDELALGRCFYASADWLRFADTDRVARSRYLGVSAGGRTVAALSSHWAPEELDPDYVAARALRPLTGASSVDAVVRTLGGRRGFLSGALIARDLDRMAAVEHLAALIRHAMGAEDAAWWWPYLVSSDAEIVLGAARRLDTTAGASVHLLGADCVIDVVGTTIDDHVAALPTRQRRTNFRREEKRFADSRLELREVSLLEHWARLAPLLAAVQKKYGHRQSTDVVCSRLRSQGEHLAARSVVFACFDRDSIVAFALAYRWGDELTVRAVGFDYARLPGADEYAHVAIHAPLGYCYRHGLRRLHLGTESYEAKCRRGARPRPLWAVTSLAGPDPDFLPATARRLAASMPAHESGTFVARVERSQRRWTASGA